MEYWRRYLVSGLVQGVGFRYHAQKQARSQALIGWVRNLPDGKVELKAGGRPDQLDQLYAWLSHGPPAAHVTAVEVEETESDAQLKGFTIR